MALLQHFLGMVLLLPSICLATAEAAVHNARDCNADLCLRALRATSRLSDSNAFCSAYINLTTRTITTTVTGSGPATSAVVTTVYKTVTTTYRTTATALLALNAACKFARRTVDIALEARRPYPSIPSYITACGLAPDRISSVCSCLIGTTAADTTTTETTFISTGPLSAATTLLTTTVSLITTAYSTVFATVTIEPPTFSTPILPTSLNCLPIEQPQNTVWLRIEGRNSTIFQGKVTSGPLSITTHSGGTHSCSGLNNNANAYAGPTCTSALAVAGCLGNFSYDGTYSALFHDFFITSIGDSAQTDTKFWGLLLNYEFTPVGGCQQETKEQDEVLWAYDAFNSKSFLELSESLDGLPGNWIGHGRVGTPKSFIVFHGNGSLRALRPDPIQGAEVGGVVTDVDGMAVINFAVPGTYTLKATKEGSIRSNAVTVIVDDGPS